jgi:hypothetical protein
MSSEETPRPVRAFQWDLARQRERFDWLLAQLPRYADWGYQEIYLHLEDSVHYPSLPGVARADAYSYRQMSRLVEEAGRRGLRVVPIVNLWGHTQYLLKVPAWRDLNELRAPDGSALPTGQICPLHPRTLELATKLLRDVAPFCTAGKVHVGLDESYHLGKHPLSRAEIAQVGLAGHFARYVGRLHGLAQGFGLRLGLWADMLALLPAAVPALPPGVIAYDWYYYSFPRRPRIELRNFQSYDLAPALRARGVEYWGCPMDGAFRHEPMPVFTDRLGNLLSWWRRCAAVGAGGFLVTGWEANRLALELTTVVDAAAASLWLDPGVTEPAAMLERGFARVYGPASARRAARIALGCDQAAFSGYRRWEINARWDVQAGAEPIARYERERRILERLARSASGLAPALASSVAFRRYLAVRDVGVRRAAQEVFRLRRLAAVGRSLQPGLLRLQREAARFPAELQAGRAAARTMWTSTRARSARGPNDLILRQDGARWRQWTRWLRQVEREPGLIAGASPVCGQWQFRCSLHNRHPALQLVVLEQRDEHGQWQVLHRRFLIEFRDFAARPRTRLCREMNVPVNARDRPLRLAIRGLGQVSVTGMELTDGVTTLRLRRPGRSAARVLGRSPPLRGFPEINWVKNRDAWRLTAAP